jgi:diketogulonate reductase-like aldo/keto reductase
MTMDRRTFLGSLAATALLPVATHAQEAVLTKPIPSSGEAVPLVGLGSWITFNVGDDPQGRDQCTEVMRAFFAGGGRMIDSSPMYGSAQQVIGYGLEKLGRPKSAFAADKVWTRGDDGPDQIAESQSYWGVQRFDLLQVHNVLDWETHLPLLHRMKADGKLRYVGITTSEGRRHDEFEAIMRKETLDFIQVTYNVFDREVEERILPLARDRGMAVIINRPFQQGDLLARLGEAPLPPFAPEIGCTTWAQFVLKFIASHEAVTCAIPATSNPAHATENMAAARGAMPDADMRARMIAAVESL